MSSDSEDNEHRRSKLQKREKKHKSKRKSKHDRRRERHHDSDSSIASRDEHKSKRHKRKHKSRDPKTSSRSSKHSEDESDHDRRGRRQKRREKGKEEASTNTSTRTSATSKFDVLLPQLYELFSEHPGLATELPYLLIRVSSGSSVNLSQVADPSVARGLRTIFQTLGCTSENDTWKFDDGGNLSRRGNGNNDEAALVLVKMTRYLMDEKGVTMDALQQFEQQERQPKPKQLKLRGPEYAEAVAAAAPDISSEIASLTSMLLEKFQSQEKDKKSSLAKELFGILNMVIEKESVCLDGIPDESLKLAMEKLFMLIGLSKEEMEDDSSDDDDNGDNEDDNQDGARVTSFGYVLPEESSEEFDRIKIKLDAAVGACKMTHQNFIQSNSTKRTLGPSFPPPDASNTISAFDLKEDSEDEDDIGPAPLGSVMAKKRQIKGPALSKAALKLMANAREAEMIHATTGVDPNASASGQREEWMMKPGEHDFLQGVLSKGIKNRTFKNEKGGNRDEAAPDAPLDPKIQQQVNNMIKMHEDSRGPSLVDQHRERKAEEKIAAQKGDSSSWAWSRDKDLDDGRRVDKSHLRMVMGGASSDLKSKFQGSYSKSFT